MKKKSPNTPPCCRRCQRRRAALLTHCKNAFLITASYQLFSLGMNAALAQDLPAGPASGRSEGLGPAQGASAPAGFDIAEVPRINECRCVAHIGGGCSGCMDCKRSCTGGCTGCMDCKNIGPTPEQIRRGEAYRLYQEGVKHAQKKQWRMAADAYKAARDKWPSESAYAEHYTHAMRMLAEEEQRKALAEANGLCDQGRNYYAKKQWKQAAAAFKAAMEKCPSEHAFRQNYEAAVFCQAQEDVEALEAKGRYADVEKFARRFIAEHPDMEHGYLWLCCALLDQRKNAEGEAAVRQAIARGFRTAQNYNNLGTALAAQGRRDEAKDAYRQAIGLDPAYERARTNLDVLEKQDDKAIRDARDSVSDLAKDLRKSAADAGAGKTRSLLLPVHGKLVEFTQADQPQDGPGSALGQIKGVAKTGGDAKGIQFSPGDIVSPAGGQAKGASDLGFDTPGETHGSVVIPALTSAAPKQGPVEIPEELRNDEQIRGWQQEKEQAAVRYAELGKQLKTLNDQLASGEGDRGKLQGEITKVLIEMPKAKSVSDAADINIREKVEKAKTRKFTGVDLTVRPKGKPATEPPPPPVSTNAP